MHTELHQDWTELAFDPARQHRLAEAARHQAMDALFSDIAKAVKRALPRTAGKVARC